MKSHQRGIGILNGPSEQEHFLAEQAGDRRLALGPAAGGETEGFEALVKLGFQSFLNGLPLVELVKRAYLMNSVPIHAYRRFAKPFKKWDSKWLRRVGSNHGPSD